MKIKRMSWHYRLVQWHFRGFEPQTLCGYAWTFLIVALLWITGILMFLMGVLLLIAWGIAWYRDWWTALIETLKFLGFAFLWWAGIIGGFAALAWLGEWLQRKGALPEKIPAPIQTAFEAIKAIKGRYCPLLIVED